MHGLVRGMDYYGWVHISRQGFRGAREVPQIPADSVIRIIAVGGSTTFDGNVSSDSNAWPAQLEEGLQRSAVVATLRSAQRGGARLSGLR